MFLIKYVLIFVFLQICDITFFNIKTKNPDVFSKNFCKCIQQIIELYFECEISVDELMLMKTNLIDFLNACGQVRNLLSLLYFCFFRLNKVYNFIINTLITNDGTYKKNI